MATLAWRRSPGKTISMFYLCTAQLRGNIAVSLGLFRPICCTRDADCGPSHLVRIPCVCKFYGVKYYLSFMTSRSTAVSRTLGTSASIIDLTGLAGGGGRLDMVVLALIFREFSSGFTRPVYLSASQSCLFLFFSFF